MHVGCLLLSEHSESYKIQLTFPKGKKFGIQRCPYLRVVLHIVIPQIVSTETILFEFGFMYSIHKSGETIQGRRLFKGRNYWRKYGLYNIEYGWDKFRDFWTIVSTASHGKTHAGKRMQVRSLSEHSNSYEFCSDMPKVGLTQRARKLIARGVFIIWDKIRDFWTIVRTASRGKTHAGALTEWT